MNFTYKGNNDLKQKATERAIDFLRTKYNFCDELEKFIADTELWFTSGRNDWYSPERRKVKIGLGSTKWHTYDRKTIGVTADEIVIPKLLLITVHIIHEFTHAIQHFQKRKYSEVETTKNEMDYIQSVSPSTLTFLKAI